MPTLKRWDLEYATPKERVLALEQNRRAGWPDWVGETGENAVTWPGRDQIDMCFEGSMSRSIMIFIAVARPPPVTAPPGCMNGPVR